MRKLLLIEDEDVIRRALMRFLGRKQFEVTEAATIEEAQATSLNKFDVVLADLMLPGAPGTAIIDQVAPTPVVVMTSHASVRSAVDVMREGAIDYIAKPFDHDELLLVLDRAMQRDRLGIRVAALERDLTRLIPASRRIDGTSLEAIVSQIQTAQSPSAGLRCFLHGPAGSGREGVARALHRASALVEGPLVIANLPALSETEKRAVTQLDVRPDTPSLRAARHGTLVVRSPDLLPLDDQRQLADSLELSVTNLICVADQPLPELIDNRRIDERFGALFSPTECIAIPPLKDRPQDVLVNAQRVIETTARRCGRPAPSLDERAAVWLTSHAWPGEVIELEALVARATVLVSSDSLTLEDLTGASNATGMALTLDAYFRWFVEYHQNHLSETELAQRLGISRKSLWERRQRNGLLRPNA